jgi:O-antigen/teichoic acid export membrane protein
MFIKNYITIINIILIASLFAFIYSVVILFLKLKISFKSIRSNAINSVENQFNIYKLTPFALLGIAESFSNNIDTLIVAKLFDASATADYFLCKKFLIIYGISWAIYGYYSVPKLSKLFSKDLTPLSKIKISRIINSRIYSFYFSFLVYLISISFYKEALNVLDLEKYSGIGYLLSGFFVFIAIHIITGPVASLMNICGLHKLAAPIVSVGAIVFIISSFITYSFFGLYGVLLSLTIGMLSWKIAGFYFIKKIIGFNIITGGWSD